ncbi:hypothetical protein [Aquabacterium sp. OR-4]|uniref:hypothetical protein n=1 Tax=Aquabacterium sp. OR-4 TaxID=2978127 RepID=UPI0021B48102|nr:hypothetical protein [Aquabacterium sp. OR-4]MDT7834798.1 hypothetical protein [Aquabacterium sp. OR-4]
MKKNKNKNIDSAQGQAGANLPGPLPKHACLAAPAASSAAVTAAHWQAPLPPALSDFRVTAFADWLEFEIELARASQARHVRASLPKAWSTNGKAPFVEAVGASRSGTSTRFRFRIQDPVSAADLLMQFRKLDYLLPLAAPVRIVGMEVGVDLWPQRPAADVVRMAEHLYRGLAVLASDNHRITGEKGIRGTATSAKGHRRENLSALAAQRTIFIGNTGDPVTQRIYAKGLARARYEVTLTNDSCPVSSLDELACFRFENLSGWFRWRTPDMERLKMPSWQATHTSLTLDDHERRRREHRRVHAFGTRADTALGKEAVKALRRLSTAQARGWQSVLTKVARLGGEHLLATRKPRPIDRQAVDFVEDSAALLNTNLPEEQKVVSGLDDVRFIDHSSNVTGRVVTRAVRARGRRLESGQRYRELRSVRQGGRKTGMSRRHNSKTDLLPPSWNSPATRPWLPFFLAARSKSYRATRAERTLLRTLRKSLRLPAWW